MLLGAVCFAILRRSLDVKSPPWLWLGLFGFVHGLNEWLDMAAISLPDSIYFRTARFIVLLLSFVCLVEFARKGEKDINGKNITAGLYIWLFILASFGLWAGWSGVNATVRYSFGLVGAIWSAKLIFSFKSHNGHEQSRLSSNMLKLAGLALLSYGIATGLVVPQNKFFPANIVNTQSFIGLFHLPVQLFRAIFAFILACAVSIYAINQNIELFLEHQHLRRRRFVVSAVFSVVAVLVMLFVGWVIVDYNGKRVAKEEASARYLKVNIFVQFFDMIVAKLDTIEAMASSPQLRESLFDISEERNVEEGLALINERADRYRLAVGAEVCYVMDADGNTVASSNRKAPDSFVGKNYSFRPYFQQALTGVRGIYLAKGVTSLERGIYVSYPVFDLKNEHIIGAVAAKATLIDLERLFQTYEYIFLVSPEGIIFVSSRPDWIFRSMRYLSKEDKELLRQTRQFGNGPWDEVGFHDENNVSGRISYQDRMFSFASIDVVGLPGWKIYLMDKSDSAGTVRLMLILIFLGFFLLVSLIILFIFKIFLDTLRLSASEALYKTLVDSSPDAIKLCTSEGKCISINDSGLKIMGWTRNDVIGKSFEELWPQEVRSRVRAAVSAVKEGRQQTFEAKMEKKDGSNVIKLVTLTPIFESSAEIKYFICVSRDVTDERQARERLFESSKIATVGSLATGVAHEFNNVLEIILGNAEQAYVSKDPDVMKDALKIVIDSARRAAWIVRSMLDFSGKPAGVKEFVDIVELVRQNIVLLNKVFETNGITVETHFSQVPRVYCNAGQISQVFINIMMNARDAMRGLEDKRLSVSVDFSPESSEVAIAFKDTGCGITDELKQRLFGPFVTTKGIVGGGQDKQPGVGLGLFVAFGIIKQHKGNIMVESEEAKGSKFTVYLPVFSEDQNSGGDDTV